MAKKEFLESLKEYIQLKLRAEESQCLDIQDLIRVVYEFS